MLKIYAGFDFVIPITISLASYYHHASGYFGGLPVAICSYNSIVKYPPIATFLSLFFFSNTLTLIFDVKITQG